MEAEKESGKGSEQGGQGTAPNTAHPSALIHTNSNSTPATPTSADLAVLALKAEAVKRAAAARKVQMQKAHSGHRADKVRRDERLKAERARALMDPEALIEEKRGLENKQVRHTYTHTHIHMYTNSYTCTHIHTYINAHIHTYTCTHIHMYTNTYTCICTCTCACTLMHTRIYNTNTHTYTNTQIHKYTHTQIHLNRRPVWRALRRGG
jgi:hypothetical protein